MFFVMGFKDLRDLHLSETKRKLSVISDDVLIVNAVRSLDDLRRVIKILETRFDEWSAYVRNADFERQIISLKKFSKKLDSYLFL